MREFRVYLQTLYPHLYLPHALRRLHEEEEQRKRFVRRNLRAAREYVDIVVQRLRDDMLLQDVGTAELCSVGDDSDWKVRDGTIRGLDRISHDGRPWLMEVPPSEGDTAGTPAQHRFDVAATVLVRDCEFEALYCYTGPERQVSGKVSGNVEIVRIDLVIAHPEGPDGMPRVKEFKAKEFTGLMLAKGSFGILHQKFITDATTQAVRSCIAQAMTSRVTPLLTTVLKGVTYPDFTCMWPTAK